MKFHLFVALAISSATALAAPQVVLETPVTYAPGAEVVEQVRTECRIEDMLANRVGDILRKRNKGSPGTIDAGADPRGAQVLKLQISHVLGIGGGAWTGPKAITVMADLVEDGKVVRHTKVNRWSVGGFWGAFKGTCSILDRSAIVIAKDMARWVRDPSYVVKDEGPPKDASAPEAAASEPVAAPAIAPTTEPVAAAAE
ncbi:MAG: hypothetical protein JO278_10310 [Dyella sp.]|nr:hypothetical protein [Dyella sp.]